MKTHFANIIVMIMLLSTIIIVIIPESSAVDPWYSTSWLYRKSMTVTGKQIGDQMLLKVGKSSGGNVTTGGHCNDNFSDLRFTDSSGNILSHWMENYTSGIRANVWINNSLNVSTIYMYYGYSLATSSSNGNTTFWFYDDFAGASLDTNKWTTSASAPTMSFSSSILTIHNNGGGVAKYISSIKTFGYNYMLHAKYKANSGFRSIGIGFDLYQGATLSNLFASDTAGATYQGTAWSNGVGSGGFTNSYYSTSYKLLDWCRKSNRILLYQNGTKKEESTSNYPTTALNIMIGEKYAKSDDCYGIIDYVFVKKYWDIEPSWSAFGSEESHSLANSNPIPSNGAIDYRPYPTLKITVGDTGGHLMNVTFKTNASGSWTTIGVNSSVLDGTYQQYGYMMLFALKKYWWNVSTNDGHGFWDNDTYSFTTMNLNLTVTIIRNGENVTGTTQYSYNPMTGYIIYDNDTGNTTSITWENHHSNTTWSHDKKLLANNSWYIYDNDTSNSTGGGTYNVTINLTSIDGFNFTVDWTGDYNSSNTNITFPVNRSMNIFGAIEVISMNVIMDVTQLGLVFLMLLTLFCIFVGYLMNNSTGGVLLLISCGLIFNLMVLVWVYFAGVFSISMTPLFVGLLVLFAKDGVIRLKNKNLNK